MNELLFIPIALLLASIWSFYKGYKQWSSGTIITTMDPKGGPVTRTESDKRMSWFSIGANWFGIIFLCAAAGSYFIMLSER